MYKSTFLEYDEEIERNKKKTKYSSPYRLFVMTWSKRQSSNLKNCFCVM